MLSNIFLVALLATGTFAKMNRNKGSVWEVRAEVAKKQGVDGDCFFVEFKTNSECTAHPLEKYQSCPTGYLYYGDYEKCGWGFGGKAKCSKIRVKSDAKDRKECEGVQPLVYNFETGRRQELREEPSQEASNVASRLAKLLVNPVDLGDSSPSAADAVSEGTDEMQLEA